MSLCVDIKKRLGDFHLDVQISSENEILGLLGASGCGKSMTLKCIAGIERPDSGRIVLNGKTLFDAKRHIDLPPQQRNVGFLFQRYALFPNMTVQQNILCGVHDEKNRKQRRERCDEMIARFRLHGLERHYPYQLSGGQQQRVALARIFAASPEILLLDEPFSALDSYLKWQLEMELSDILSAFDRPVVYVSHDRGEVYCLTERVCVMDHGSAKGMMAVSELFSDPVTLPAALLSGCKNFSKATRVDDTHVFAADWGIALHSEKNVPLGIKHIGARAHMLSFCAMDAENAIPCVVERRIEDVFSTIFVLRPEGAKGCSGDALLRLEQPKNAAYQPAVSERTCVCVPASVIMMLS